MVDVLAVLLLASPVLAGGLLGYRAGAAEVLRRAGPIILGWAFAILAAAAAWKAGWFQPLGLVTPLALGLVTGLAVRQLTRRPVAVLVRRAAGRLSGRAIRPIRKTAGALCGSAGGLVLAATLWFSSLFAASWMAGPRGISAAPPAALDTTGIALALLRTAHHGFVRHLPVVGPAGDEVEALGLILNAGVDARARLADEMGWERIADLPSFRAIVEDSNIFEEIDRVRRGRVDALYRLQRHPKIIAFVMEEEVQKVIAETRPSILAKKLADLEAAPPPLPTARPRGIDSAR